MSIFQSIYWRIPVLAQKFMGVWPYDDATVYNKTMPIIVYVALYALVVPIGIRGYNEVGVHNLIALENLIGQMYLHGALIKLTVTILNKKRLKAVYDLIANDWKNTDDEEELQIMKEHASLGRKMSIFYILSCGSTAGCFLSIPMFKPLLDFVIPLENASRPLILPYYAEYYIDQQKYYLPLITKAFISGMLSMTVFVTYDMSFAMCGQHVCSLFDIISLRIRRASEMANRPLADVNHTYTDCQVFQSIVHAIELHKTVITNVSILEEAYYLCWFVILILNTVGLGCMLVVVLGTIGVIEDTFRYGMFFLCIFIHKFYVFLPGQKIINYSLLVSEDCYSSDWLQMSPRCKVLIKIMMLRTVRPLQLTGGKMFVLCMATYFGMLKAGMSYFTMLANVGV